MDPREFVETRTKRYMAQALEEFERQIEIPLLRAEQTPEVKQILQAIPDVKRTFRKRLQALASDCLDLVSPDLSINGYEPVKRG